MRSIGANVPPAPQVSDAEKAAADALAAAQNARQMVLNRDPTLASLQQTASQFGSVTAAADAVHKQLQDEITALQQQLAAVQTTPGPQGPPGKDGPQGPKGDPGTPADMTRVAALEAAVTALQALKVTVGYGTLTLSGSLLAGATQNVTVTLSRDMGAAVYSIGTGLVGGTSLLGALVIAGVVSQTRTTVTLQIKNTGLSALANLSTATVHVVAARDAP